MDVDALAADSTGQTNISAAMNSSFPLKISTPAQEGVLNVSRWLKHAALLSGDEMEALVHSLPGFLIYDTARVVKEPLIASALFVKAYRQYIDCLKQGEEVDKKISLLLGAYSLSVTPDIFYGMVVREGEYLIKPTGPVVQMQMHHFLPSTVDGNFYSMVFGRQTVSWGLQFAYPQIFQPYRSKKFLKVSNSAEFPNTALFTILAKWLRTHSVPVSFVWQGCRKNVSFRIGRECFSWIHNHPQLKKQGIEVYVY
jgi:hypothetical protein